MVAAPCFSFTPGASGTELRLLIGEPQPVDAWALSGHPGTDICERWLIEGEAVSDGTILLVENAAISRLTAVEGARLNLPRATSLRAVVEGSGIMTRPDFAVRLRWTRPSGQNVIGAPRTGAWLREAEGWRRLPETLFAIAEAVDAHEKAVDPAERLTAVAALTRALPQAALSGSAEGIGLLGKITVLEADAFSLDCTGEGEQLQLIPVLHRNGTAAADAQLLDSACQHAFGQEQFLKWPSARSVYTLPGGVYVTVAPALRQALDVVRRVASRSLEQRLHFLREPRGALRAALGDDADDMFVEGLVVETPTGLSAS